MLPLVTSGLAHVTPTRGGHGQYLALRVPSLSHVRLLARILEWVAPLGDLPNPGIKAMSSALAGRFFTTEPRQKPLDSEFLLALQVMDILIEAQDTW